MQRNVGLEKMRFGAEPPRLTSRRFRGNLEQHQTLERGRSFLQMRRHHAPIGVRGMGTVNLRNAVSSIIPGRKVVVSGPANFLKEGKAKGKEKAKEKGKAEEEEKERGPL